MASFTWWEAADATVAEVTNRVDVYDIASEEWIEEGGAEAPLPAGFFARAQVGSYFYIVGGYSSADPVNSDQTQRYDMSTDTWEVGPAFTSRRALGTLAVTSTRMYMLGGDLNEGSLGDPTNLVEVLDLTAWPGGTWVDLGDPLPVANIYPSTTCTEVLSAGEIWDIGGVNMVSGALTDVYYRLTEACSASEYGVSVTPESDEKLGATGETIDFPLTVSNTGYEADTFDITLSGNLWATVAPLTTGLVDAGESRGCHGKCDHPAGCADGGGGYGWSDLHLAGRPDGDGDGYADHPQLRVWRGGGTHQR